MGSKKLRSYITQEYNGEEIKKMEICNFNFEKILSQEIYIQKLKRWCEDEDN